MTRAQKIFELYSGSVGGFSRPQIEDPGLASISSVEAPTAESTARHPLFCVCPACLEDAGEDAVLRAKEGKPDLTGVDKEAILKGTGVEFGGTTSWKTARDKALHNLSMNHGHYDDE